MALYLPNGDFIKEDAVCEHTPVLQYIHDLENGIREPRLRLPVPEPTDNALLSYELLWGETTLGKNSGSETSSILKGFHGPPQSTSLSRRLRAD